MPKTDARYRDADFADRPLRLVAQSADDLAVISTLTQDAVGRVGEVSWNPRRRRLAILLNRFRWEDRPQAERQSRPFERVRSGLIFDSALTVRARGIDPADRDTPLSLLRIDYEPDEEGLGGRILLVLSGAGEVAIEIECIDVCLMDLTRPWEAPSGRAPDHPVEEAG